MATWDINPGNNAQSIIDAHTASGEIFLVKAGNHIGQIFPLRSGQKLLFEGGVNVNGNFGPVSLGLHNNNPNGIEVRGLDVSNRPDIHSYAAGGAGGQDAVIRGINGSNVLNDWLIQDIILRDCFNVNGGIGIAMGENTTLRRVAVSGMGKAGVNWSGGSSAGGTNTAFDDFENGGGLIDDCDIFLNGLGGSDCGGISKIVHGAKGRVIRNSRFWGNRRANIWADFLGWRNDGGGLGVFGQWSLGWLEIDNCDLFQVGEGTLAEALFMEVSSGIYMHDSRIYNNQSVGGGGLDGAHVITHNGAFNTIEDNIIFDCGTRSSGNAQSSRYPGNGQLHTVEGVAFRRNRFYAIDTQVTWLTGLSSNLSGGNHPLLQGGGGGTFNPLTGGVPHVWEDNEYNVLDTLHNNTSGVLFNLANLGGNKNFSQWQALGFDVNGSYNVLPASQLPSDISELEETAEEFIRISSGGRHGRSTTKSPRKLKGGRF